MTRVLTAAWAAFGLVVAGALAAIVVTGLLEGLGPVPDSVSSATGVGVFLAAMLVAGKICEEIAGRRAVAAGGITVATVAMLGWGGVTATESHGEGLEPQTLAIVVVGLAALLASSVWLARRRAAGMTVRAGPGENEH